MSCGDFEKIIMKIIAKEKNLSDIDKCRYEDWSIDTINFEYSSWENCTQKEQDKFIFSKKERLFECISGNTNMALNDYQTIKHQNPCLQENLYGRNNPG